MKVIELLNKIANGEEVPKEIKYQNYIYEYQHRRDTENSFNYMCNENGEYLSRRYFIDNILNEEVEILKEGTKMEKLYHCCMESKNDEVNILVDNNNTVVDKLNEIIDKINSMEDK